MDKGYCWYHAKVQKHVIQECTEFRNIIQDLMDKKDIEFSKSNARSIDVITGTTYPRILSSTGPKPVTIFHDVDIVFCPDLISYFEFRVRVFFFHLNLIFSISVQSNFRVRV